MICEHLHQYLARKIYLWGGIYFQKDSFGDVLRHQMAHLKRTVVPWSNTFYQHNLICDCRTFIYKLKAELKWVWRGQELWVCSDPGGRDTCYGDISWIWGLNPWKCLSRLSPLQTLRVLALLLLLPEDKVAAASCDISWRWGCSWCRSRGEGGLSSTNSSRAASCFRESKLAASPHVLVAAVIKKIQIYILLIIIVLITI